MPGLAGLSRMPYRRFLFYNALGGIAWGVTFCLVGYLAGNSYEAVAHRIGMGGAIITTAVIVGLLVAWRVRRRLAARRESSAGSQPHGVPQDEKVPGDARRHP
jgi:membrane protein DedA with SNARE-associated domain